MPAHFLVSFHFSVQKDSTNAQEHVGGCPGVVGSYSFLQMSFLPNVQREAELPGLLLAGGADGLHVC